MPLLAHLLLPDRWRVELILRPLARDAWLTTLSTYPSVRLLDWAGQKPSASDLVLIAGLDLAAAELVLKLPEGSRILAVDSSWVRLPWDSRSRIVKRAWARVEQRLVLPHPDNGLPSSPSAYLAALLAAAERIG